MASKKVSYKNMFLKELKIRRDDIKLCIQSLRRDIAEHSREADALHDTTDEQKGKMIEELTRVPKDDTLIRSIERSITNYEELIKSVKSMLGVEKIRLDEEISKLLDTELLIMHIERYDE